MADASSVAEIKKKFDGKRVMVIGSPKMPIVRKEPSVDSSDSERLTQSRSNDLRRTSEDINAPAFEPTNNEATFARVLPQGPNTLRHANKQDIPLPASANRNRNEDEHCQSSADSVHAITSQNANHSTGFKKAPVPLPPRANRNCTGNTQDSITDPLMSDNAQPSTILKKPIVPLPASSHQGINDEMSSSTMPSVAKKPPVPLPGLADQIQTNNIHCQSLSVTLDSLLPSRCMFYELDNTIDDYQRTDARTIVFSKQKPPMPKMTKDEVHSLQRYLNT
ncbi:unnamed protein product [Adineta ricciae]|uniref:Uncharacterized protein n=1 Tax=Adineta ricciae TaxID=249248 RepID=A0A813MTP6_ADIRI|nr:unnamed protein product [Adineta ricciae]CAF1331628.1 unnamed protein product [Adineta ricciae]